MRFIDSYLSSNVGTRGTAKEQAKSGLRLGIGLGLFLIAGMLLSSGMGRVVWSASSPHYVVWPEPIGWLELTLATAILLSTAGGWWMLLAGCMVLGSVKCVIVLLGGGDVFASQATLTRLEAVELLVFAVASVVLMLRLWKKPLTIIDRVAVMLYLYSFMWHADRVEFSAAGPGLALGLFALLVAWCVHWWRADKKDSA
ncbi:MAG: hypothetical protein ROO76_06090 [Terriglobia bacterium]|nr:hypothetical protein [Terriglobia bacterium]